MTTCGVSVHIRRPVPPFTEVAGPFFPQSVRRSYCISEVETADVQLAVSEIGDPRWLIPGACWSIESNCEPPWVGFVRPGELELGSATVHLALEGATALLDIEVGVSERVHTDLGSAIFQMLEFAQSRSPLGVFPGNIERAVQIDTSIRGDTILSFLQMVAAQMALDWRIRAQLNGKDVVFYLDIGGIQRTTNYVIVKDDIISGSIRQKPVVGSVTAFGAAPTFDERRSASVNGSAVGALGGNRMSYPPEQGVLDIFSPRNIGPAAATHRFLFMERTQRGVEEVAVRHLNQALRGIDQLLLSLDHGTFPSLQAGDTLQVQVFQWMQGLSVTGPFHVRRTEPSEEDGDKDVVLWALL